MFRPGLCSLICTAPFTVYPTASSTFLFANKYPKFVRGSNVCCSGDESKLLPVSHFCHIPLYQVKLQKVLLYQVKLQKVRELRLLNEMSGKPAEGHWEILFFTEKRNEILRKNFYSFFHHSLLSFESDCHRWSCESQLETTQ